MFLVILKGKKLFEQKVTKRKDHGLYVKWKGYNSSFNSWIDKKEIGYFIKNNTLKKLI